MQQITNTNSDRNLRGGGYRPKRQDDVVEIDLVDLAYQFLAHWWQLLLSMIVCGAAALAVTFFLITPLYKASARIYIASASSNSTVNMTDLQIGTQLMGDYEELILTRPLLNDVISSLKLDMDYEQLVNMIEINTENRILQIVVTSPIPEQAADIANELAEQACIYLPRIMETEAPHLVESAVIPTQKASPSMARNTVIGIFVGFLIDAAYIVIRYMLNDTIVTPDDVEKYIGIQPLAVVPEGDLDHFNHEKTQVRRRNVQIEEKLK